MGELITTSELANLSDALSDPQVASAIRDIVNPHYQNPQVILDQEVVNNDHIYLSWHGTTLVGFFMTGWQDAPTSDQCTGQVYLGLSGVHLSQRGQGIGSQLYRKFLADARTWVTAANTPLWYWFYTASPFAANVWHRLVPGLSPMASGEFDSRALRLVDKLAPKQGWSDHRCTRHPFVLRNFAKARYAPTEVQAIQTASGSEFLSNLDVNEQAGDRVVFVGFTEPDSGSTAPTGGA